MRSGEPFRANTLVARLVVVTTSEATINTETVVNRLAVDACRSSWAAAGAAVCSVDADARREAECFSIRTLHRVAQTRHLVVNVALPEVALAVEDEASIGCKHGTIT